MAPRVSGVHTLKGKGVGGGVPMGNLGPVSLSHHQANPRQGIMSIIWVVYIFKDTPASTSTCHTP